MNFSSADAGWLAIILSCIWIIGMIVSMVDWKKTRHTKERREENVTRVK